MPPHEKSRSQGLIDKASQAVQDESLGKERYQQLAGDLHQALHMIASAACQQTGAAGGSAGAGQGPQPGRTEDEDVVDAEFKEH